MTKPEFVCEPAMRSHVARVLMGDYGCPLDPDLVMPRVLDIGANLGAFAIWATERWPGCSVTCFEPHPGNFKMLCKNITPWPIGDCRMQAVSDSTEPRVYLYDGKHNCGEASLVKGPEQNHEVGRSVDNFHASKLPACDVLKIDTEGMELRILRAYPHLANCTVVMLEAHSRADNQAICQLFEVDMGWRPVKDMRTMPDKWTMVFTPQALKRDIR